MIRFYFHTGPNPMKVALFLEETGLPYEVIPVDTLKGEQHKPQFLAINPNAKTPAIVDTDGLGEGPVTVFDSNAILLYLADKSGKLLGRPADRGQLLSWLMFVATGLGPYSGQSVHFRRAAPEPIPYAQNRYLREAERHYKVLDAHLEGRNHILGEDYTIVDIAAWGWIDRADFVLGEGRLGEFPNIARWFAAIEARPAVARARAVGKDIAFKREIDDEARRNLFPQNYLVA
ncbi:MAG: glutathione S-transferase family protein [Acidocella sp.]